MSKRTFWPIILSSTVMILLVCFNNCSSLSHVEREKVKLPPPYQKTSQTTLPSVRKKVFDLDLEKNSFQSPTPWNHSGKIKVVADRAVSSPENGVHSLILSFINSNDTEGSAWIKIADLDLSIHDTTVFSFSQLENGANGYLATANLLVVDTNKDGLESGKEYLLPLNDETDSTSEGRFQTHQNYRRVEYRLGERFAGKKIKGLVVGVPKVPKQTQGYCHFDNFEIDESESVQKTQAEQARVSTNHNLSL